MPFIYIITPLIVYALYKRVVPFKEALKSRNKDRIKHETFLLILMSIGIAGVYWLVFQLN